PDTTKKPDKDNEPPELYFENIPKWTGLGAQTQIILKIQDESPIDWTSFKLYPDTDWKSSYLTIKPYKISRVIDDPNLTKVSSDSYHTITYKPSEDFIYGWSYFFNAEVCDCSGNCTNKTIFTAVCTSAWCFFNTIPSYLLAIFLWWYAIFSPIISRKRWSEVYNSKSKESIPNVILRLFSANNKLIETQVSDTNGTFSFNPPKGKYKISATKTGYTFPSKLNPIKIDGDRTSLYYGEFIEQEDKKPLGINIPMDPIKKCTSIALDYSIIEKVKSHVHVTLSFTSPVFLILGAVMPVILWGLQIFSALTFSIFLGLFIYRQLLRKKERGKYGLVTDQSGKPVKNIEIGVYEAEFDTLVTSGQTDTKGRYIFILPGNRYKLKIHSPKYELLANDLIVEKKSDETILIGLNLTVKKLITTKKARHSI
ncbi:hypothetical protein GF357_01400, partial [Candidatus Dojkabacteria bacterium]|nr:hypothetical protein [Candidatus Dojkabacteria bacterium]